jgi:hypothetical protein
METEEELRGKRTDPTIEVPEARSKGTRHKTSVSRRLWTEKE